MGLINYLKTQFLEIIEWQDDSRDTLSFHFPDGDKYHEARQVWNGMIDAGPKRSSVRLALRM